MKYLVLLLLCSLPLFAQTAKKASTSTSKIKAELVAANERIDDLQAQIALLRSQNTDLAKTNTALTARNDELAVANTEIKKAANEVLINDRVFAGEYGKILTAYNQLAANYNDVLKQVNVASQQANEQDQRLRKQQNTLLLMSLMKMQRAQTFQPYFLPNPPPIINCTSNSLGNTTYTNCK